MYLANPSCACEQATLLLLVRVCLMHALHHLRGHLRAVGRANERLHGWETLLPLRVHTLQEREDRFWIRTLLHFQLIRSRKSTEESGGLGLTAHTAVSQHRIP
jgi:hypothetical protein